MSFFLTFKCMHACMQGSQQGACLHPGAPRTAGCHGKPRVTAHASPQKMDKPLPPHADPGTCHRPFYATGGRPPHTATAPCPLPLHSLGTVTSSQPPVLFFFSSHSVLQMFSYVLILVVKGFYVSRQEARSIGPLSWSSFRRWYPERRARGIDIFSDNELAEFADKLKVWRGRTREFSSFFFFSFSARFVCFSCLASLSPFLIVFFLSSVI